MRESKCENTDCQHYSEMYGNDWCIECRHHRNTRDDLESRYEPYVVCPVCGYEEASPESGEAGYWCFRCWQRAFEEE